MSAEYKMKDGVLVVAPTGDIDHHETKTLREDIDMQIEQECPSKVVFDFSRTQFMDSSGLGLILGRYKKARDMGIKVEIANPGEKISKILYMAGIEKIIEIKGVER